MNNDIYHKLSLFLIKSTLLNKNIMKIKAIILILDNFTFKIIYKNGYQSNSKCRSCGHSACPT
jgi:hypothetical protein